MNLKSARFVPTLACLFLITGAQAVEPSSDPVKLTQERIRVLVSRVEAFKRNCGFYPSTANGFDALLSKEFAAKIGCTGFKKGGYIKSLPLDAWGKDFGYRSDGQSFEIFSAGADGIPGGAGVNADIYSNALTASPSK